MVTLFNYEGTVFYYYFKWIQVGVSERRCCKGKEGEAADRVWGGGWLIGC